jgi:hypothetical protein
MAFKHEDGCVDANVNIENEIAPDGDEVSIEPYVVSCSNTCVQPLAVVVESIHTLVANEAVS